MLVAWQALAELRRDVALERTELVDHDHWSLWETEEAADFLREFESEPAQSRQEEVEDVEEDDEGHDMRSFAAAPAGTGLGVKLMDDVAGHHCHAVSDCDADAENRCEN